MEQVKEETKRKLMIRLALSGNSHHVYTLKCGAVGTGRGLFNLAKSLDARKRAMK